jgi:uncharacterized protein with GYD domain
MPTYISLLKFTQKGVESIKEGPKRLDAAKQRFREAGAELKAWYLVMGEYDAVAIVEAPNDETLARLSLTTAAMGYIRSETLRALTEADYRKIVATLP